MFDVCAIGHITKDIIRVDGKLEKAIPGGTAYYTSIAHQITAPVAVGATFSSFEEIGSIVDRVIPQIRERGQDLHWVWRETRSIDAIAKILFPSDNDSTTKLAEGTERQQILARQ
ncbi:MAG: hypothetical protein SWY16_13420 [Cyanobacteriota bacterium]|nr:hypothetical protein [Cyanobacteriota bacterium]